MLPGVPFTHKILSGQMKCLYLLANYLIYGQEKLKGYNFDKENVLVRSEETRLS